MLNRMILGLVSLMILVNLGAATVPVNETIGEYRISFESSDNTSLILKGWHLQNDDDLHELNEMFDVSEFLGVMALDTLDNLNSGDGFSGAGVLVFDEPINTTFAEFEILEKLSPSYMRVYDRAIDMHKGIYIQGGNGPNDLGMSYGGMYWLDEDVDGIAKELVVIVCLRPKDFGSNMETILNTLHIEKIEI